MKHSMDELDERLVSEATQLGLSVSTGAREMAIRYLAGVLDANRTINLTRIVDPWAAVHLHLLDSLAAMSEVESAPEGRVLDLGTGGGFPGVPLAIATGRRFTLLDSVAKKGAAIQRVLSEVGVDASIVRVESGRAEELAARSPGAFAAVVARAVAPLPSLVELAAPLLVPQGLLIALKGCPEISERESGAAVGRIVGMSEHAWRVFCLPGGGEDRTIVTYVKDGSSKVRLPRRTGLAQRSPLA